jgi:hypothetical protein
MSERFEKGYMPWDRTGNRLLVKSQLGKNKPTNYDIPNKEFVYGRLTYEDLEHANNLMYQWKYHDLSPNGNHLKQKDFKETNKAALKSLLHTSSQFSDYRKSNTQFKAAYEGTNVIPIKLPEQNHAYGKPLEYIFAHLASKIP